MRATYNHVDDATAEASARLGFTVTRIIEGETGPQYIGAGAPVKGIVAETTAEGWAAYPHIARDGNPYRDEVRRWAWDDGWCNARDHYEG